MSKRLSSRALDTALKAASAATGVPSPVILSRDVSRQAAYARHHAMWLLRQEGFSYPQIGSAFNRYHTTVMDGVEGHIQRAGAR